MQKMFGCILMILGTTVGAAMLALPIVSAHESFYMSLLVLFASWALMTIGAYSLLEVNLWLPENSNMISMADKTLGKVGKAFTWFIYLLLLYTLICAYLSGLGDILQGLLANINIHIPRWLGTILSLLLFGIIVQRGIASVDIVNRGLMGIKLFVYVLLIVLLIKYVDLNNIYVGDYQWRNSVFMVMLTSFGYAIIFPSLRGYLKDENSLKKVIWIGSLIPLIIYAAWIFVIQGLIPKMGEYGLISMIEATNPTSLLMNKLSAVIHITWVSILVKTFISICAVTSFLGVSISLTDFVADGISVKKTGSKGFIVYLLAFLPPLLMVLTSPGIFVRALDYGGLLCLILLVILPLLMLYVGRYKHGFQQDTILPGRRFVQSVLFVSAILLVSNLGMALMTG